MTANYREDIKEPAVCWDLKADQFYFPKATRGRLVRSESDAVVLLSTLPTINEDFKNGKSFNDDSVFALKRPISSGPFRSSSTFLPPLCDHISVDNAKNESTARCCKNRPSTPRPIWSSNSHDMRSNNRQAKKNSVLLDNIEGDKIKEEFNSLAICSRSLTPFSIPTAARPQTPLRETQDTSNQNHPMQRNPSSKHTVLPKSQLSTSLRRQKMESKQIPSSQRSLGSKQQTIC